MTAAITTKRHHNKIRFIATAPLVGTLLLYHSANNLFYSYACYWNDSLYATPQWKPGKKYRAGVVMELLYEWGG